MEDDDRSLEARAARRRDWPGKVFRLGQEPREAPLAPERALAAMRLLAERAWNLAGRPLPHYNRQDMPGRIVRGAT